MRGRSGEYGACKERHNRSASEQLRLRVLEGLVLLRVENDLAREADGGLDRDEGRAARALREGTRIGAETLAIEREALAGVPLKVGDGAMLPRSLPVVVRDLDETQEPGALSRHGSEDVTRELLLEVRRSEGALAIDDRRFRLTVYYADWLADVVLDDGPCDRLRGKRKLLPPTLIHEVDAPTSVV